MKEKCFIVFLVLCLIVFVFGGCKNNTETETTTEITTGSTTVVTTEETTEKKETVTTTEATTEKKTTEAQTEKNEVGNTEYITTVTTTKKQESTTKKQEVNTTKPVTTTKRPVETQVIKETTTKKPTTTKSEYYPALTQADIEEIKQYTINYIRSKGQIVEPSLDWSWAGYSTVNTVPTDLSIRGDKYKINGGVDPVEWVKGRMRDAVDIHIEDWERQNGEGTIGGLYPLVKLENGYWNFALGYC